MREQAMFVGGATTETTICFYGIKVYRRIFIRTHRSSFSSPQNHHEGPGGVCGTSRYLVCFYFRALDSRHRWRGHRLNNRAFPWRRASAVVHDRSGSPGVPGRSWRSWNSRSSSSSNSTRIHPISDCDLVHVKEAEMSRAVLMQKR